jgi:hypothetical protein
MTKSDTTYWYGYCIGVIAGISVTLFVQWLA